MTGCLCSSWWPGRVPSTSTNERVAHVIDVGVLSESDRDDAMAAADAVVQPSAYESFSRTMMEAWLAGTWVIANGASAVSRWHCERSGAGRTYSSAAEFAECLHDVAHRASEIDAGAARGRDYVLREYTWPVVLDRVEAAIEEWFPAECARMTRAVVVGSLSADGRSAWRRHAGACA